MPMLSKLNQYFLLKSKLQNSIWAILLTCLIATIDYLTGYEISFSLFYLLPVGFATWYLNRKIGILFSVISALIWLANDYFTDHLYSADLIPIWNSMVRFGFFIITSLLLSEIKRHLNIEQELARTDGLTDLLNKRTFNRVSAQTFKLASRYKYPVTIGLIDVDNFKLLNDTYGHAMGDKALKMIADTISKSTRATDITGRIGGDEFAIVLPFTHHDDVKIIFNNLLNLLHLNAFNHGWSIGFSIGVAHFINNIPTVDVAIKKADGLMYQVKNSGKGSVIYETIVVEIENG